MADFGFFSPATATKILARLNALESAVFGNGAGNLPQLNQASIYVHNVSGQNAPAYACFQCVGTEVIGGRTYIQVDQPSDKTGESGGFLFNSSRPIADDGNGVAFAGPQVRALGDGSTATAGDRWAPNVGTWTVGDDPEGIFMCVGDDNVVDSIVRLFCHQAPTVKQRFITDIRVSGNDLQYKYRDIFVFPDIDESGWETWHSGEDCTT